MALDAAAPLGPILPTSVASPTAGQPWAWRVLLLGAVWGVVAALLLRDAHWGLNLALVVLAAALLLVGLPRAQAGRLSLALPLAIAFAAALGQAWRASPHLRLADAFVLLAALAWPLAPQAASWGRRLGEGFLEAFASSLAGAWLLAAQDVPWARAFVGGRVRDAGAVGLGLALALPFLLLFGGLMAMADANFEALSRDLLSGWPEGFAWAFWAFVWAWPAWGYARALARGPKPQPKPAPLPAPSLLADTAVPSAVSPSDGAVAQPGTAAGPSAPASKAVAQAAPQAWRRHETSREAVVATATALALVDALFAAFVALQLPHLFGGAEHLASTPGLTAATYARRGFFELSLLAILALPALVGTQAAARGATGDGRRLLQALGGAAALMLGAVLLSAAHRMGLYAQAYGLTVARVEVLAAEAWGAFALLAYACTVLRWRPQAFGRGVGSAALVVLALLHLWPMEEAVVRHDLAHGVALDAWALQGFSADAVPVLVAEWPGPAGPNRSLEKRWTLNERFEDLLPRGWRDAHWGEAEALAALARLGPRVLRPEAVSLVAPGQPATAATPHLAAPSLPRTQAPKPSQAPSYP